MTPLDITWDWPESAIVISATIVLGLVLRWVMVRAIRLGVESSINRTQQRTKGWGRRAERVLGEVTGISSARHAARTRTLGSVLRSFVSVVITIVIVLTIMSVLNIPTQPILATAGIGGVAVGFGAQSLVKDYLSGIFMILEDQYGVGDIINTGDVTGTVEDVGLRVTRVRDAGGQVWYIRNGEILRVGNQSQGWSTGIVDIPVAYDEDPARVIAVLDPVMDEVFADERWADVVLEKPTVAGVNEVRGGAMVIRVFAKCAPNQHWAVQRDILERGQAALQRAGVRGPVVLPPLT